NRCLDLLKALYSADYCFSFVRLSRNGRDRASGGMPFGLPSRRRERLYHGPGIWSDRRPCREFLVADHLFFDGNCAANDHGI
ncbi:MAG: hypothetical protein ACLRLZ_07825, partial [Parasutterella excrementihominis]|uniref:hypothetical protein n=1 Tax=Parasutterella excrementihominis TaxID=487175 RepID=UPI00399F4771